MDLDGPELARVPRVVTLSSVGADLPTGTGPILGLRAMEERFNQIPGIHIVHLRPGYFLENVLPNIGLIKSAGINVQETENIVFEGAHAAVARIHLSSAPSGETMDALRKNENVIDANVVAI